MRTTLDAETILYQHIKGSALESAVTGSIWKGDRKDESELEDIVINSLPITTNTIQRLTANVNIYVKDIPVPGVDNHWIKDNERLGVLAAIGMTVLGDYRGLDYDFYTVSQTIFKDGSIKQHYLNFRIDFELFPG